MAVENLIVDYYRIYQCLLNTMACHLLFIIELTELFSMSTCQLKYSVLFFN